MFLLLVSYKIKVQICVWESRSFMLFCTLLLTWGNNSSWWRFLCWSLIISMAAYFTVLDAFHVVHILEKPLIGPKSGIFVALCQILKLCWSETFWSKLPKSQQVRDRVFFCRFICFDYLIFGDLQTVVFAGVKFGRKYDHRRKSL